MEPAKRNPPKRRPPVYEKPSARRRWAAFIDDRLLGYCTTEANASDVVAHKIANSRAGWYSGGSVMELKQKFTHTITPVQERIAS